MCKINDGELVARVRAAKKGKILRMNHNGTEMGGKGTDGRKKYDIRKLGVNRWTCSCKGYRFTKGEVGKKAPCKHLKKIWHDMRTACFDFAEVEILVPEAF